MKNLLFVLTVLSCFVVVNPPVYGGDDGSRGASSRAYERASDRSIFNRVGDWFATTGKSDAEKEAILQERQEKRAAKRAEKAFRKGENRESQERKRLDDDDSGRSRDDDDSDSGKGKREQMREEREERYEERHREKRDEYRERRDEYREKRDDYPEKMEGKGKKNKNRN
ncbi:MAG: hypothetical protein R3231_05190 [bacterium]|nr:hypothetical protein [bacterium]